MMPLVNLNNNNNVMQREKDKENERSDFSNGKSKNLTWMASSGKKDFNNKFDQKSAGKQQQQFVENQNQKNKKDKVRRKQNGNNSNNINITRTEFVPTKTTDSNGSVNRKDNRISTGTMTANTHKNNGNSRYQYDPNQIYSLGMQMNHTRSNSNRLSPTLYRNNANVSPSTTESSSRGSNYDVRYHDNMNVYPQHQWMHGANQVPQNENNWHNHHHHQYNHWLQNSPAHNSFNNRLNNRPWRSNNYLNQNGYRNRNNYNNNEYGRSGAQNFHVNAEAKRNNSPSPSLNNKPESPIPHTILKKSLSKSSLTEKSSRSSVNSSPDNRSSELEYDSDTSRASSSVKASSGQQGGKKSGPAKRLNKSYYVLRQYESRSAPEPSTLNEFVPSSDLDIPLASGYCAMPPPAEPYVTNGNDLRNNMGFYQQQPGPPYYGAPQCLQINNWVSNLGINGNGVVGSVNNGAPNGPAEFQMFVHDVSYDNMNNNGEFVIDDGQSQKKQRSLSKESLTENGPTNNHLAGPFLVPPQQLLPETNNNYMFYLNPKTLPHQPVHQSPSTVPPRSKHLMNHVHRFNLSPSNKNQQPSTTPTQVKVIPSPVPSTTDNFFYNTNLPFVKDEPKELLCGSKWDPISKDIWKKFTVSQQSETMYNKKIHLWRCLYTNIRQHFPQYGLYMVGSTIAGFGTDSSDVDMCLVSRENQTGVDLRTNAMVTLSKIERFLQGYPRNSTVFDEFQLIQARVPILRFKDVDCKIEVDLNYNNCVGIRNTHLLHCYAQMDWRLRPLVLIVKLWAQFHNINDARNATLPSYSLVLMVIHFLQYGVKPAVLPCLHKLHPEKFSENRDYTQINMNEVIEPLKSENKDTLGELFVKFLEYYCKFDYSHHAISIRTGMCLPIEQCRQMRAPKNDPHQWKVLCIEEPFDHSNTARSVYDPEVFERVKATFMTSWQLLSKSNRLDSVFSTPLFTPVYHQQQQYSPPPMGHYPMYSPLPPIRTTKMPDQINNKVVDHH